MPVAQPQVGVEEDNNPFTPMMAPVESGRAPGEPAPSDSIRTLLEIMGSRIGSGGKPLAQDELSTFLREVDAVIETLPNA